MEKRKTLPGMNKIFFAKVDISPAILNAPNFKDYILRVMKCDSVLIWGRDSGNVKTSSPVISIAAGECHFLIATESRIYSAGSNGYAQLGLGHNDEKNGVNKIENLPPGKVQQVSAGR